MNLSWLPKVDKLMLLMEQQSTETLCPPLLLAAAREAVDQMRAEGMSGALPPMGQEQAFTIGLERTEALYREKSAPSLRRVLNATGIVLHTNLGRAVLADAAVDAVAEVAQSYSNLEMDLQTGRRSSRYDHVRALLCLLTGAEDALVVNNNAAAMLLALDTLGAGGEAIVSRGELVEIGGSFRIPDILEKTGVALREVGCTNRTRLADYERAITEQTKLLVKVHPSNFSQTGFVEEVSPADLAALGSAREIPVLYDLGSGSLYPLAAEGVGSEPVVAQMVESGVDVLCFSGDKLLGGPQAGILLGKRSYIGQMKQNPLTRALRIDKFTLAALEATLRLYLEPDLARCQVPTLDLILETPKRLQEKAELLAESLAATGLCRVEIIAGQSEVGGGSLPGVQLPTSLVCVEPHGGSASALLSGLRQRRPAVLGYIREERAVFDPRTLCAEELQEAADAIVEVLEGLEA